MSTAIGIVLSVLGVAFGLAGILVIDGISIEIPGIMLGAAGYYLGLTGGSRLGQALGIAAVVLCVISIGVSAFDAPPQ